MKYRILLCTVKGSKGKEREVDNKLSGRNATFREQET
jgi:hypothetical protein